MSATSSEDGWYNSNDTGLGDYGPHLAGTLTLISRQLGGNAYVGTVPSLVLLGANGDVFHVGPIDVGTNALGADCIVTGYAIAD